MSSIDWKIRRKNEKLEAFSNENFTTSLENTEYDCLVSVATSYFPWLHLANYNFSKNTKVIIMDDNEENLAFQKWFLQKYNPDRILKWQDIINKYLEGRKDTTLIPWNSGPHTMIHCNDVWDRSKGQLDSKWEDIKNFSFEFVNKDISERKFKFISDTNKPMIYFGDKFNSKNTSFVDFLNNIVSSNQQATWSGETENNIKCYGPNSSKLKDRQNFYIPVDVPKLDCEKVLQEIQALEENNLFTPLRTLQQGENNPGWSSFAIHGIEGDADKILAYGRYGYDSDEEAPYRYTDMAKKYTPTLVKYFEENKIHGHEYYHRVRIMKLAPAGYISIHDDDPKKNKKPWDEDKGRPSSLNMCINNPDGCEMHFWNGDFEYVGPMKWNPNDAYTLRIHWPHMVRNLSNKPRYHLIVHGRSK